MVKEREKWKWLEQFLLCVKLLLVLKHLVMVCKAAADTPGIPKDSAAVFSCFWNRWPLKSKSIHWFAKAIFLLRSLSYFPLISWMGLGYWALKPVVKEVLCFVPHRNLQRGEWRERNYSDWFLQQKGLCPAFLLFWCCSAFYLVGWVFFKFLCEDPKVTQAFLPDKTAS